MCLRARARKVLTSVRKGLLAILSPVPEGSDGKLMLEAPPAASRSPREPVARREIFSLIMRCGASGSEAAHVRRYRNGERALQGAGFSRGLPATQERGPEGRRAGN